MYAFEGWYDITLTTTFAGGQFSVDGGSVAGHRRGGDRGGVGAGGDLLEVVRGAAGRW